MNRTKHQQHDLNIVKHSKTPRHEAACKIMTLHKYQIHVKHKYKLDRTNPTHEAASNQEGLEMENETALNKQGMP